LEVFTSLVIWLAGGEIGEIPYQQKNNNDHEIL